jgi:anti-sigma factor RsiW
VAAHRQVDVVVVERVGGGAVHERRLRGGHPFAGADQRRLRVPALLQGLGAEDLSQRLGRACDGDAEPIEQALLGERECVGREDGVADAAAEVCERAVDGLWRSDTSNLLG